MENYLYRCDDVSCGERDIKEVIKFETCELGNVDIWGYCIENYNLSHKTKEYAEDIISTLIDDGCVYEIIDVAIDSLIKDLTKEFGFEPRYCIWLGDYNDVKELYGEPTTKCQPSNSILSDLGSDGILYAFLDKPNEIEICGTEFEDNLNCN